MILLALLFHVLILMAKLLSIDFDKGFITFRILYSVRILKSGSRILEIQSEIPKSLAESQNLKRNPKILKLEIQN